MLLWQALGLLGVIAMWAALGVLPWCVAFASTRGRVAWAGLPAALLLSVGAGASVPAAGLDDALGFGLSAAVALGVGVAVSAATTYGGARRLHAEEDGLHTR